ncbi:MAG: Uncharacterized protein FD166_192 [Bacteroidetes bacterium]|nr:MAG: Uncharacterized protein FD166_192 [Bacteroidota bacterium]
MSIEKETLKTVIRFRRSWISKRLNLSNPDLNANLTTLQRFDNVKRRLSDLSKVLFELYKIYNSNRELYGEEFLAFVGDKVIRNYPWKDLPFSSVASQNSENNIREHWTPISFFRDAFMEENWTENHFFCALLYYYRIVNITNEENQQLEALTYRTTRPLTAYSEAEIQIHEAELWSSLYDEFNIQENIIHNEIQNENNNLNTL